MQSYCTPLNNYSAVDGFADTEGTKEFVNRAVHSHDIVPNHFRQRDGIFLSSIGMGTYLGDPTVQHDELIEKAIYDSVKSGAVNVLDTAINYRYMKSEKCIGRALSRLIDDNVISRNQVFVCTKNGYITNDADYPSVDVMEYIQKMFIDSWTNTGRRY